jgi:hypothetical protein
MLERSETAAGSGFSVLDGAAIVTGAAVASIHIRGLIRGNPATPGWVLIWGTFAWLAVTASGPFLFLVRRFLRRLPDYPKVGDVLWTVLGIPWLLTAVLRSANPTVPGRDTLFGFVLAVGLAAATVIVLVVVWNRWVMVPAEEAARTASAPWTNRVGLILSVAWPIQCGVGLVILD